MLTTDLVVAMGLLILTVIPFSLSFLREATLCRAYYYRSVAMEIVDGEMEKLAAGEWKHFKEGQQSYAVKSDAAKNLHGEFTLEITGKSVRLEFVPAGNDKGGKISREVNIP